LRKYLASFIFFNFIVWHVFATSTPISIQINELKANAEIVEVEDKEKPFFIILHGSFAWHGMELPQTVQNLLAEEGMGSIAFTLTLGENDRQGFFDCSHPILGGHDDALVEIDRWIDKANQMGYKNVHLIAHSRGGAQVALYSNSNPSKINSISLIAPLVWDKQRTEKQYLASANKTLPSLIAKAKNTKTNSNLINTHVLHCGQTKISPMAFISYYDETIQKNTPTLLQNIEVRTRIYLGDEDSVTSAFMDQKLVFKDNPHISIKMIEDADHFFRDFAADDLVSDIIEHIDK